MFYAPELLQSQRYSEHPVFTRSWEEDAQGARPSLIGSICPRETAMWSRRLATPSITFTNRVRTLHVHCNLPYNSTKPIRRNSIRTPLLVRSIFRLVLYPHHYILTVKNCAVRSPSPYATHDVRALVMIGFSDTVASYR